jgi:hypothetical protein
MRTLLALTVIVAACGSPQKKKESSMNEGSDVPVNCCCKTIPTTAEKEIIPNYAVEGRMECSTKQGECVPDVQCNGAQAQQTNSDGVPPPPPINNDNAPAVP